MDVTTRQALADRVREARRARKMSQRELAAAADVSLGMVSNLERQVNVPQPANLRAILRVLDIDAPPPGGLSTPVLAEESGGRLEECETCHRVMWPDEYELLFDMLGAYFNALPPDRRQAASRELVRDVTRRQLGGGPT